MTERMRNQTRNASSILFDLSQLENDLELQKKLSTSDLPKLGESHSDSVHKEANRLGQMRAAPISEILKDLIEDMAESEVSEITEDDGHAEVIAAKFDD